MRIVLTHPFCWPYVRRGTERNVEVLGQHLAERGHEVITVSTRPGAGGVERSVAGTRILRPPLTVPLMGALRIQPAHTFFFTSLRALSSLDADVVHSFYPADALAAAVVKRRARPRTVLQMNGVAIPGVSCHRWLPPEGVMFRQALRRADHRIACSQFVRALMREHYGVDSDVISPPVLVERYPLGSGPVDRRPTILGVADFTVRRKGVRTLVAAFALLKQSLPAARLRLSGRLSPELQHELLSGVPHPVRSDIEVLGLGRPDDLPRLYGEASVTVLPAMWEPSGTVLVESLACGTPVVATNHAGIPEFVTPETGVLFDPDTDGEETPNVDGLAGAMRKGLALSQQPGTRAACRAHALRYGCAQIVPQIERLYAASRS
jgi:phosphatidylinositol alpha-mannosyltransferase